ncbi:unnamed protein product [Camellia sinensis]
MQHNNTIQRRKRRIEMSKKNVFIGSTDKGTTSTRFIIYDKNAHPIGSHQEVHSVLPTSGSMIRWRFWRMRIFMSKAIDKVTVNGYNVDGGLKAIGLTNQRETTIVWSKSTGLHLYNACSICRCKLGTYLPMLGAQQS